MSIIIKKELDSIFEITGLLKMCHTDNWQDEVIQRLDAYGVGGKTFYEKHYRIVEKYINTFKKYKVSAPQEEFLFKGADDNLFLMLLTSAVENRKYLDSDEEMNPMELRSFLAFYISDTVEHAELPDIASMPQLPDEKSMIDFLDKADLKSEEKWYVLDLLRKPDYWFGKLIEIIRLNIPAYEKAKDSIEKQLDKLLKSSGKEDKQWKELKEICGSQAVIYNTLVFPVLQASLYSYGYMGVLNQYLENYETTVDAAKGSIIRQSKSFSDKSKLDILCSLKASSKYNLELAETLGLSPSTTSHHMNALLECGFVTVEKKDGKVYYCLQEEMIQGYIDKVKELLL